MHLHIKLFSFSGKAQPFFFLSDEMLKRLGQLSLSHFSICYTTKEWPSSHSGLLFSDFLQCNVKCGQGLQHRNVICRDGSGHPSSACDFAVKPVTRQPCTGQICDEANEDVRQKKTATLEEEDGEVTTGWMKINSGILKPPKVGLGNTQRPFDTENTTRGIMREAISAPPPETTTTRIPSEPT